MLNAVHSPGVSTAGYRTILNSRYEVVEALDFLTDLHEFEYLGPKHYLYMSYDVKDRADGSCMIDQSVVESKDGHILNHFDVSEYLQSGYSLGPKSKVAFRGRECDDVAHINGVQVIGASTWLISLGRGTIVSWDRDKKKPLWIFGQYESQFKIDPYVALRETHTPRFFADESRLVVFENGEPPTDVRIIDFKLDIKSKRSELRDRVKTSLKQKGLDGESRDGMDMAIVSFNKDFTEVEYAGANNPLWIFRRENNNVKILEFAPDKRPIGYFKGQGLPFTNETISLQKGDTLYIFSDGYADQFGGPKGKKFKYKQIKEILAEINHLPMHAQEEHLLKRFVEWRGNLEQIDDVCIIGISV